MRLSTAIIVIIVGLGLGYGAMAGLAWSPFCERAVLLTLWFLVPCLLFLMCVLAYGVWLGFSKRGSSGVLLILAACSLFFGTARPVLVHEATRRFERSRDAAQQVARLLTEHYQPAGRYPADLDEARAAGLDVCEPDLGDTAHGFYKVLDDGAHFRLSLYEPGAYQFGDGRCYWVYSSRTRTWDSGY